MKSILYCYKYYYGGNLPKFGISYPKRGMNYVGYIIENLDSGIKPFGQDADLKDFWVLNNKIIHSLEEYNRLKKLMVFL